MDALEQFSRVPGQTNRHHRLQSYPDRLRRNLGVVAQDGPIFAQATDAFERGRGRDAGLCRQILVWKPRILPQQAEQDEVDSVESHDLVTFRNNVRFGA